MKRQLKTEQGTYELITKQDSTWILINKDDNFLAIVADKGSALQVVYQDVHDCGGECDYLDDEDFKVVK